MRAVFIRHAQSTGNVGVPCGDLSQIELTERGRQQAVDLSKAWVKSPTLIVTSPYLRTQQTAQPTIERFSDVPVEIWSIQEFTYLEPARWNGTLPADRRPHIDAYWNTADPEYCDGQGAESFGDLLRRVENTLERLAELPSSANVLVFAHSQFIQALRICILHRSETDAQKMQLFRESREKFLIRNAEPVFLEKKATGELLLT
jgi:2,3-bisphosphoglycerate-dependent phosphoglycerate mutase